jgi:hypothetical protein
MSDKDWNDACMYARPHHLVVQASSTFFFMVKSDCLTFRPMVVPVPPAPYIAFVSFRVTKGCLVLKKNLA